MANTIITNKLATLVAANIAKSASFLKVGSASYFADQIKSSTRPGLSYEFIIPSTGSVRKGLAVAGSEFTGNTVDDLNGYRPGNDIDERRVQLTVENWNNSLHADALELALEANDMEKWAEGYGIKIANAMVKEAVNKALSKTAVAFVGEGWQPLAKAPAYLGSICSDKIYAFANPFVQAVLSSNGQQFVPKGAPDSLYKDGELGIFQNAEYYAERFVPGVTVTAADASATITATVTADKVKLSGTTFKLGMGYTVEGIYACDMLGEATDQLKVFVIGADQAGKTSAEFDIVSVGSNREVEIVGTPTEGKLILAEGSYKLTLFRCEDAFNYTDAPVLNFKFASTENSANGGADGVSVAVHAFTRGENADNLVRFDSTNLMGVIDSRITAIAYIKD